MGVGGVFRLLSLAIFRRKTQCCDAVETGWTGRSATQSGSTRPKSVVRLNERRAKHTLPALFFSRFTGSVPKLHSRQSMKIPDFSVPKKSRITYHRNIERICNLHTAIITRQCIAALKKSSLANLPAGSAIREQFGEPFTVQEDDIREDQFADFGDL